MSKARSSERESSETVSMESLKDWVRSEGADYLKDPNITSVGIGYKEKDGELTDEIAVQFTVERKAVPELLEALGTEPIPESVKVDGVDVPTDVRAADVCPRVSDPARGSDRRPQEASRPHRPRHQCLSRKGNRWHHRLHCLRRR